MSDLGRALIGSLDDEDLDLFVDLLGDRLNGRSGWLDTKQAAEYAGCSVAALRSAVQRRQVEYEQAVPNGKTWFSRDALDRWRRTG